MDSMNIVTECACIYSQKIWAKVIKTHNKKREFGVKACRVFHVGEFIYELAGLVPKDNLADHSNLSCILTHVDQAEPLEDRVLFGPIRLINHHCTGSNIQVCKCYSIIPTGHLNCAVCHTVWKLCIYYQANTSRRGAVCKLWPWLVQRKRVPMQQLHSKLALATGKSW